MALGARRGPGDGDILVTGANGGVGSVAIALLAKLGYRVVAATGTAERGGLSPVPRRRRGDRSRRPGRAGRPLGKGAGPASDTVGSHTLANACATPLRRRCGRLRPGRGMDFPSTVMPFILRGVTLYGRQIERDVAASAAPG